MRYSQSETLRRRLESWREELRTNKNGFAHLAESAIKSIEEEIAQSKPPPSDPPRP